MAARGAVRVNVEREGGKVATCWLSVERTSLKVETWAGSSAGSCMATGGGLDHQGAWPLVSVVLAQACLGREERAPRSSVFCM